MSTSILSRADRKQNNSTLHTNSNKSLKFKSHRVLRAADPSNIATFDDRLIAQQLNMEMNKIDQIITNYRFDIELERVSKKKHQTVHEDILELDDIIRQKDAEIKCINSEIKLLKEAKNKEFLKGSRQSLLSPETFTLAEELRNQANQLKEMIEAHSQKMMSHKMLQNSLKHIERDYNEKFPNRELNYLSFKEKAEELKKEQNTRSKKKQLRIPSIKQKIQNIFEPEGGVTKIEPENRSMKELLDKKKKMTLAIKNAKKKHQAQIVELTAKLEFLRDEDALLNEQIKQKKEEKQNLQDKFNMNYRNRMRNKGKAIEAISFTHQNLFY